MALPKVIFEISSNGLNKASSEVAKTPGLMITGSAVAGTLELSKAYKLYSLKDAEALGITETGSNAFAWKQVNDFYTQAGTGSILWLMLVAAGTTMASMADKDSLAGQFVNDAAGAIRVLGLVKEAQAAPTLDGGMDEDVAEAVMVAEELGQYCQENYRPLRVVVSGNNFSGTVADLTDYSTTDYPHVGIYLANNDGGKVADIGALLGRIASIPVQRSIARVKDGAVEDDAAYLTSGEPVDTYADKWDILHDMNYIFLRSFAGRSGFYFSDDNTLAGADNDFNTLARGMVMDEATIIAYDVMVEELSDEVPMTEAGKIHPAVIKSWQANLERGLDAMVSAGKLSSADVLIDADQNVLVTDQVIVQVALQPVGYAKKIIVQIGFTTKTA